MSETTKKLRALRVYSRVACGIRDRAADAIEAVEAQVAEAVARVEKLEKMGRLGASPNGDDRTRGGMPPRGFDSPTPAAPTPPAPSAVPAPRGFRVGDTITTRFSHGPQKVERIEEERIYYTRTGDAFQTWTVAKDATLVRAADAPEAPAEDAGLVERLARIIVDTPCAANHEGQCIPPGAPLDDCDRANARAVLSDLTAESRLCAPGEVARLKDELAEANGACFLNANAVRLQKARAEAAEKDLAEARAISAATAERVRNETQIATELRKDLADSTGTRDRLVRELSGERVERDYWKTRAEDVTKELDALKAKPRFRTRPVTAADVRALDDEWAKSKYVGRDSWSRAMNAVGLRRRVDGAK